MNTQIGIEQKNDITLKRTRNQARIQRGGPGVRTPPPLRFVRGWVLCSGLMGGRGGPTVVFALILSIFFWLASLASIIETYYMYTYFKVQCSVWNGRRHFLSIFPFNIQIMNRIHLPIPCIYERAFSDFSCLELHDFTSFKPNIFSGGGPPDPLPDT